MGELEEEAADGTRCCLGTGEEDLCHLVDNIAGRHAGASVRLFTLFDEVLEQVSALDVRGALTSLHYGIDCSDHLGRPVELQVDSQGAEEFLDVYSLCTS